VQERVRFFLMGLHKRMGHCAERGNAEPRSGQDVGRTGESGEVARAGGKQSRFRAMGAAQAKIDQRRPLGDQDRAAGFGGDHGLEIQQIHHPRFNELRFRERRGDAENRLVGKKDRAFRHGMHIAGEPHGVEGGECRRSEGAGPFEPIEIVFGEMKRIQVGEDLLQACCHEEISVRGQFADKKFEDGVVCHVLGEVGLRHREFV